MPNAKKADGPRVIIGWREYVAIPEWGIEGIRAKADTGARTSAIDVGEVEELPDDHVRFEIVVRRTPEIVSRKVEAAVVRRTRIKSSFGAKHDRLVVRTRIRIGLVEKEIELGLVSRKKMICRMLLGRAALEPEFLVDSGRWYMFGRRRPRSRSKT